EGHGVRRHGVPGELQSLALRRAERGERARDRRSLARGTARRLRGRRPRPIPPSGAAAAVKRLALIPLAVLALSGASAHALRLPSAPRCPIFPADNAWNQRVDALPVAPNSAQLIASIGSGVGLHPDFGSGLYD